MDVRESGRSAYVKCHDTGHVYLRNRIFLKSDTVDNEDDVADIMVVSEDRAGQCGVAAVKSALRKRRASSL